MHLVSSHIVKIIAEAIAALKSVSRDSLFENAPILISEIDKKTAGCVGIHLLSGIPDEMNDRLFQPFQTTKPVGLGTGLGLSICILLVRKYNGSIECESSPGSGALFRVILPVSKTRDVSPIAPTEKTPPVKKISGTGKRVLIVDDDSEVLGVFHEIVSKYFEVKSFRDSREALQVLVRKTNRLQRTFKSDSSIDRVKFKDDWLLKPIIEFSLH